MADLIYCRTTVGADEAGRGHLAGPVVAAAVRLNSEAPIQGLNDSKKLDRLTRERLYDLIIERCDYAIEVADLTEIERLNILHASEAALARAIRRLNPETAIVDGNRIPPGLSCPCRAEVKGDGRFAAIAAASVLAKVTRDRLMTDLAAQHPKYGFDRHFGYATPEHLAAIRDHGPCAIHRRTFSPIREMLEQPRLFESV